MQVIDYDDYRIIATAFNNEEGKWIGQAELQSNKSSSVPIQTPIIFDNELFNSEQEAEDFALDGAQFFIDTQLKNSGLE